MHRFHHIRVVDEIAERHAVGQLEERGSLADPFLFHFEYRLDNPFQGATGIEGGYFRLGLHPLLRHVAVAVQWLEHHVILEIVEVQHSGLVFRYGIRC